MTQTRIDIPGTARCIDLEHLCSKNDFDCLTNHFDRKTIIELVNSINDRTDRKYVIKAIELSHKLSVCPLNDDEKFYSLLHANIDLENEYLDAKQAEEGKPREEEVTREKLSEAEEQTCEKDERFTAGKIGYLVYFLCDDSGIHADNDDTNNINQKEVKAFLSKLTGYSSKSFNQKVIPDFNNMNTIKMLSQLAKEIEPFLPKISKDIRNRIDNI